MSLSSFPHLHVVLRIRTTIALTSFVSPAFLTDNASTNGYMRTKAIRVYDDGLDARAKEMMVSSDHWKSRKNRCFPTVGER